jgi:arylsulfatase A-like enzyme
MKTSVRGRILAALTDVPAPGDLFGSDLRPIFEGHTESVRDAVFLPYLDHQRAVSESRWKLHCYPQINHQLLFDLDNDPHEMTDLASDPTHAGTLSRMVELLQKTQREFGDELPLSVDDPEPKEVTISSNEVRAPDGCQPQWIREKYF